MSSVEANELLDLAGIERYAVEPDREAAITSIEQDREPGTRPAEGSMAPSTPLDAKGEEPNTPTRDADVPQILNPFTCLKGVTPIDSISASPADVETKGFPPEGKEASKQASKPERGGFIPASLEVPPADDARQCVTMGRTFNWAAPASAEVSASSASSASSEVSASPQRLDIDDIWHMGFQLWHNSTPGKSRKAQWTLKLRATLHSRPDEPPTEVFIGFHGSRRRQRAAIHRYEQEGKITPQWSAEVLALIAKEADHELVGLFCIPCAYMPNTKMSRNARDVVPGCWATMTLNADASAPREIVLHLADRSLVNDKFEPANATKANGPRWIALFDPDNVHVTKREIAHVTQTLRRGEQVKEHQVTTKLARMFLDDQQKIADLEQKVVKLQKERDDAHAWLKELNYGRPRPVSERNPDGAVALNSRRNAAP